LVYFGKREQGEGFGDERFAEVFLEVGLSFLEEVCIGE
jgi:hypothetical protein